MKARKDQLQNLAQVRADVSSKRGRAQRGAFVKGFLAFHAGRSRESCPYRDVRSNYHNGVTFSRGMARAWVEGYEDAKGGAS